MVELDHLMDFAKMHFVTKKKVNFPPFYLFGWKNINSSNICVIMYSIII